MVVKRFLNRVSTSSLSNEHGQSVLEFLLGIPIMLALFYVMARTNTAIQMSIVNQKYAREQTLYLTQNSPVYPRRDFVEDFPEFTSSNRMILGVAEQSYFAGANGGPIAPKYRVTRAPGIPNAGVDQQTDPFATQTSFVRIVSTVALCTPSHRIFDAGGNGLALTIPSRGSRSLAGAPSNLQNASSDRFAYCYSYIDQFNSGGP